MSRRKKTGAAQDLIDLIAMLPWWVGVVLAAVSYVALHQIAISAPSSVAQPGQVGAAVLQSMWTAAAMVGQHVLPIICLAGAAISAWRRHERKSLIEGVAQSPSADALNGMTWSQFEQLVGEGYRQQGYSVTDTGAGADGGVDLILAKGGEKFLVQCKQWRAFKVGVEVVRELYGVMAAQGAAGGFVVTSGRFTEEATKFAAGRNVQLVDGPKLHALIQLANTAVPVRAAAPSKTPTAESSVSAAPACPLCAKTMTKRVAKRGASAGNEFWGCTGYPTCKGTSAIY